MKKNISLLVFVTSFFSFITCSKFDNPAIYTPPPTDTISFTESLEDFPNPERGFYRVAETSVKNYHALDINQMKQWRTLQQADDGNYKVYSSLVFRQLVLTGFTNKLLSQELLDKIKNDFTAARIAGVKLILRFCYTVSPQGGSCPEGFICPPYGDAPKNIVLNQIAQLKPLFQQNADVIACIQMGFIGTWGENYYSDYFGDPSSNGRGKLVDKNWQEKNEVLKALLDALPASRMIQVRTPQMKQRYVYGIKAPTNAAALTESEAFTPIDKARIGFHNDCFLSSADDYGTYDDYGNSSSPHISAYTALHNYFLLDGKYVPVGGETCDDTYSPENDCENSGKAQTEMRNLHYSFLNCAYNNDVNNDWQTGGCMDAIKKNLGYRFVLRNAVFPATGIKAGTQFSFTLNFENIGYASPYNERPVKLVMRIKSNGLEFLYDLNTDPRKWFSGKIKVDSKIITISTMPAGVYEIFLFLPDKYASVSKRPEYAIRFANENVWEENTGYNKLMTVINVN